MSSVITKLKSSPGAKQPRKRTNTPDTLAHNSENRQISAAQYYICICIYIYIYVYICVFIYLFYLCIYR